MVKIAKLHIDGMHCSACSASIQSNLEKNSSILNTKINTISGKAKISYEESQLWIFMYSFTNNKLGKV